MKRLRALLVLWKKTGQKAGEAFSAAVLFLVYFLCVCPWAFVTRLAGKKWIDFSPLHPGSGWLEKGDDTRQKTRYERLF